MTPDVEYDSARDSLLRELDRMRGSVHAPHLLNRIERFIDAKIALHFDCPKCARRKFDGDCAEDNCPHALSPHQGGGAA